MHRIRIVSLIGLLLASGAESLLAQAPAPPPTKIFVAPGQRTILAVAPPSKARKKLLR
jgi:hypothetical protein